MVPTGINGMKILPTHSSLQRRRSAAAFTLVETLVAFTLGAIMLGALYNGFAYGYTTIGTTRQDLRATEIILRRLERVRLCSYSQITDTSINPASSTEYFDPDEQATGAGGTAYAVSYSTSVPSVGTLPEAYRTNMILVTVS